jgi:hypothetical protein
MVLDIRLIDLCYSVSRGEENLTTKDLILTLFGFIFRRIYTYISNKEGIK